MLTHKASIGKLAEDEINHLQVRGFTYDQAVSLLVRGFITTMSIDTCRNKHGDTSNK